MSGGIHRVAQSKWDCPNKGHTKSLHLYFALDCGLPKDAFMKVTLPATLSAFAWDTCAFFAVTTTLTAPTTGLITGTKTATHFCKAGAALAANTAYGLQLTKTVTPTIAAGAFAPVGLETRMGTAATQGPVLDSNPVFDSVFVIGAPLTMTVAATKLAADVTANKKYPGSEYTVDFLVQFTGAGWVKNAVLPPYELVFDLTKPSRQDRV